MSALDMIVFRNLIIKDMYLHIYFVVFSQLVPH